jgi:hypothetical protein
MEEEERVWNNGRMEWNNNYKLEIINSKLQQQSFIIFNL